MMIEADVSHVENGQNIEEENEQTPAVNADEPWNLCFKNITKVVYDKHTREPKTVLSDVSGVALPGEMVAIMGLCGSGKTTLLRVLGGRDYEPFGGEVFAKGVPMNNALRRRIGFIPQFEAFLPSKTLTARQQLTYVAYCRTTDRVSAEQIHELVRSMLQQLNILHRADAPLKYLSGGERKRVSIGCELLTNPRVLLIDEATSNLDSASVSSFLSLARSIAVNNRIPVVITIHQPTSSTFFSFDRIMLLFNSRVIFNGKPAECRNYFQRFNIGLSRGSHSPLAGGNYGGDENYAEELIQFLSIQQARLLGSSADGYDEGVADPIFHSHRNLVDAADPERGEQNSLKLWDEWQIFGEEKVLEEISDIVTAASSETSSDASSVVKETKRNKYLPWNWYELCPSAARTGIQRISSNVQLMLNIDDECKPPGSFLRRVKAVAIRSYQGSLAAAFTWSNIGHTFLMSVLMGVCWFQMEMQETTVGNYGSFVMFVVTYFFFSGIKSGILLYFPERTVYRSERLAGTIDSFSFLLGRWLSLLPTRVALPALYIVLGYLFAIKHPTANVLFQFAAITVVAFMTGEAMGLLVATTTDSIDGASSNGIVVALVSFLLGGSFVQLVPEWLVTLSKVSVYKYLFNAAVLTVFVGDTLRCDDGGNDVTACYHHKIIPMRIVIEHFMRVDSHSVGSCMVIVFVYNIMLFLLTHVILVFVDNKRSNV